jgi:hypothetical protein
MWHFRPNPGEDIGDDPLYKNVLVIGHNESEWFMTRYGAGNQMRRYFDVYCYKMTF